jgi:hypothetical protein
MLSRVRVERLCGRRRRLTLKAVFYQFCVRHWTVVLELAGAVCSFAVDVDAQLLLVASTSDMHRRGMWFLLSQVIVGFLVCIVGVSFESVVMCRNVFVFQLGQLFFE